MNIQAMMKQAQKMQKDMMNAKEEIDNSVFEGKSSFVTVEMKGNKELTKVKIDTDNIESDEIEMLEDMILVAVNEASKKVDEMTDQKMGNILKECQDYFKCIHEQSPI